jgi:hypothetical protein
MENTYGIKIDRAKRVIYAPKEMLVSNFIKAIHELKTDISGWTIKSEMKTEHDKKLQKYTA